MSAEEVEDCKTPGLQIATLNVSGRGKTMETAVLAMPTVCATLDKRLYTWCELVAVR